MLVKNPSYHFILIEAKDLSIMFEKMAPYSENNGK